MRVVSHPNTSRDTLFPAPSEGRDTARVERRGEATACGESVSRCASAFGRPRGMERAVDWGRCRPMAVISRPSREGGLLIKCRDDLPSGYILRGAIRVIDRPGGAALKCVRERRLARAHRL